MLSVETLKLMAQFGLSGVLLFYLFYRDKCDREDRRSAATRQEEIDKKDIDSREKLATSLAALSIAITGRPNV